MRPVLAMITFQTSRLLFDRLLAVVSLTTGIWSFLVVRMKRTIYTRYCRRDVLVKEGARVSPWVFIRFTRGFEETSYAGECSAPST